MTDTTPTPVTDTPIVPVTDTAVTPTTETTEIPAAETKTTPVAETTATPVVHIKGYWSEQKGKLKSKFPILTDADLYYENGKKNEMFTKIQEKIGKTKEEFATIMETL